MNKSIILIFFAFLGLTIVSGRVGLIETLPPTPTIEEAAIDKCDYCKTSVQDIQEFIKEHEPEEFIDIDVDPEVMCEKVCPPKKISWFTLFG